MEQYHGGGGISNGTDQPDAPTEPQPDEVKETTTNRGDTEGVVIPDAVVDKDAAAFTDDINGDEVIEAISTTPLHDTLKLLLRTRGEGVTNVRINIYPDSARAALLAPGSTMPSGLGRQAQTWKIQVGKAPQPLPYWMTDSNARGFAVAWVPNPVDPTGKVVKIVVVYTELDGGRRWSPEMQGPDPDIIISSKNGDHLYWIIRGVLVERAEGILRALAIFFGGDPEVARIDHGLRLPGFMHAKKPDDPFEVKIVPKSSRSEPWDEPAILKAMNRAAPSRAEWDDYKEWSRAAKHLPIDKIGAFGTESWRKNQGAAVAYTEMAESHVRISSRRSLPALPAWEEGRSPAFWLSHITAWEFIDAISSLRRAGSADPLADLPDAVVKHCRPSDPEWLSVYEPLLRAYTHHVRGRLAEANRIHMDALKADPNAAYQPPEVLPFDVDKVSTELIEQAPPLGFARRRQRTGPWNLHTADLVELSKDAGIYVRDRGVDWHEVTCPWADLHGDPAKDAAGVRGPVDGHPAVFKCFHNHGHGTFDFVGWLVERLGKEAVENHCERFGGEDLAVGAYGPPTFPTIIVGKDGLSHPDPKALENTRAMLAHHRVRVVYNLMVHGMEIITPVGLFSVAEATNNAGWAHVRNLARKYGLDVPAVEDHIRIILAKDAYHPVAEWIDSRKWDGRDRFATLFGSLTLAPGFDSDLAEVLLRTWLVSAACAATVPAEATEGQAMQGVLVLQGEQNIQKTRWLRSLAPADRGWLKDGALIEPGNRDSIQKNTRFWIVELGELDATFRKADIAKLKAFITELADNFRSAYDRREEPRPRRTVFCGSVNPSTFLVDSTGNRRFWTIPVVGCDPGHGVDIQQLWAQAAEIYRMGHPIFLDKATNDRLATSNKDFEQVDLVAEAIERLFVFSETLETSQAEILNTLKADATHWGRSEVRRACAILRDVARRHGKGPRRSNGKDIWPFTARATAADGLRLVPAKDPLDDLSLDLLDNK